MAHMWVCLHRSLTVFLGLRSDMRPIGSPRLLACPVMRSRPEGRYMCMHMHMHMCKQVISLVRAPLLARNAACRRLGTHSAV